VPGRGSGGLPPGAASSRRVHHASVSIRQRPLWGPIRRRSRQRRGPCTVAADAVGRAGVWAARHRRRPSARPAAVRRLPAVRHVLACLMVAAFCLLAAPSALNAIVGCLLLCRQREIDRVAYVLQDPRPLDAKQFDLLEVRHCPPVPHPCPCGSCALTQEVIPEWLGVCQAPWRALLRLQVNSALPTRRTLEQWRALTSTALPWSTSARARPLLAGGRGRRGARGRGRRGQPGGAGAGRAGGAAAAGGDRARRPCGAARGRRRGRGGGAGRVPRAGRARYAGRQPGRCGGLAGASEGPGAVRRKKAWVYPRLAASWPRRQGAALFTFIKFTALCRRRGAWGARVCATRSGA